MINVNELRIGNLITWNPQLSHPQTTLLPMPVEVASLSDDKIGYLSPGVEHRAEPFEDDLLQVNTPHSPLEEFEPIPLTAELLEKCGFKKQGDQWSKGSFLYRPAGDEGRQPSEGEEAIHVPRYLHQLQNLYFDTTGDELEVNG